MNESTNPTTPTTPPLEDYRVATARKSYAEYQANENNPDCAFWLGRFEVIIEALLDYIDQQASRS